MSTRRRALIPPLFLSLALTVGACFGHAEVKLTYVNESGVHVTVWVDGERWVDMDPGIALKSGTRPKDLPDHIEAFDDAGNRIFSVTTVDVADLEAMDFKIVIRKTEP